MAITVVSVHARYLAADQTTAKAGTVSFTLTDTLRDTAAHKIIRPSTVTATLDGTGAFTVNLLALDESFVQPTGVRYKVQENIVGQAPRGYFVTLSHTAPSVELADLTHL